MSANSTLPEPETSQDELLVEEEDYSSGNGRLAIVVGLILLLAIVGYMFVPGTSGRRVISSVMPSVMLGEANVTGSRIVDEPAASATSETTEEEEAPAEKPAEVLAQKAVVRPAAEEALATRETASLGVVATQPEPAEVAPAAPAPAATEAPATITLSGRILDENGRPLAGATVLVKGSRRGTGTDANGNYSLEVPAGDNALVYGYGGYQDQEVRTRGSQPVNVTLLPAEGSKRRR
jgi:hypothetical protein